MRCFARVRIRRDLAEPSASDLLDSDKLKEFAAGLRRPASTLIAVAPANDPFAITSGRRANAQWFAYGVWQRLC